MFFKAPSAVVSLEIPPQKDRNLWAGNREGASGG